MKMHSLNSNSSFYNDDDLINNNNKNLRLMYFRTTEIH